MSSPDDPGAAAVEARDLVKRYGSTQAVNGVSFQAARGRDLRLSWGQRCGQDDHPTHDLAAC